MKETNITMFSADVLTLIFSACDKPAQRAIVNTSSRWHQIMYKVRENNARAALRLLGPRDDIDKVDKPMQQQYYEKMRLVDQRAKRLADWFSSTPPNPKYTGEFLALGLFGGGEQEFKSFASYDMDRHVFHDDQFYPHVIILRAIEKYSFSHAATCPLDNMHTSFLEVLISSSKPFLLKCYLEHFHAEVSLNEEKNEEHSLEVAQYEQVGTRRLEVMEILAEYGAILNSDRLNTLFEDIKDDDNFDLHRWSLLANKIENNAIKLKRI